MFLAVWCQYIGVTNAFARQSSVSKQRHCSTITLQVGSPKGDTSGSIQESSLNDSIELPLNFPRRQDVLEGMKAVRKACGITDHLQPTQAAAAGSVGIGTTTKTDSSPVTVADFAAQAIVLQHLKKAFPEDSFIAEESSATLLEDAHLTGSVLEAASSYFNDCDELCNCIDLGKEYLNWGKTGRPKRVWCLDPIDGTKGFLRGKLPGGQYCVALALLEDGVPTIGILGCPNLPASATDEDYAWTSLETEENNKDSRGCVFVASEGGGCFQLSLAPGKRQERLDSRSDSLTKRQVPPHEARFCVGVEESFADPLGKCKDMASILHGTAALDKTTGDIVKARRIDSQAKYGVLARGGAEFYVRLPKDGYNEWIWDVAPGIVVLQEAGGTVTDTEGQEIDCSRGANLSPNVRGVLGANDKHLHQALVQAFQEQENLRKER
jgi:HAL2 family 3'(2'),5'-bisphosphate nucleotidase